MSLIRTLLTEREANPEEIKSEEPELIHLNDLLQTERTDDDYDQWGLEDYDLEDLLEKFHSNLQDWLHERLDYEEREVEQIDEYIDDSNWVGLKNYLTDEVGFHENKLTERIRKYIITHKKEMRSEHGDSREHMEVSKILKDELLFHFTDNASGIYRDGFKYGVNDPEQLGITTMYSKDSYLKVNGGYNFAYDEASLKYATHSRYDKYKYGQEIVALKANAIKVWHHGDQESQCIFWGKNARHICTVNIGETKGFYYTLEQAYIIIRDALDDTYEVDDIDKTLSKVRESIETIREYLGWVETQTDWLELFEEFMTGIESLDKGEEETALWEKFEKLLEDLKELFERISNYSDKTPLEISVSGKVDRVKIFLDGSESVLGDLETAFSFVEEVIDEM